MILEVWILRLLYPQSDERNQTLIGEKNIGETWKFARIRNSRKSAHRKKNTFKERTDATKLSEGQVISLVSYIKPLLSAAATRRYFYGWVKLQHRIKSENWCLVTNNLRNPYASGPLYSVSNVRSTHVGASISSCPCIIRKAQKSVTINQRPPALEIILLYYEIFTVASESRVAEGQAFSEYHKLLN